jgi:hypothetical protein
MNEKTVSRIRKKTFYAQNTIASVLKGLSDRNKVAYRRQTKKRQINSPESFKKAIKLFILSTPKTLLYVNRKQKEENNKN